MEYAISKLFDRIAGRLTPTTEIVRCEIFNGENIIALPLLVTEVIDGVPLRKCVAIKDFSQSWARWQLDAPLYHFDYA